MLPKNRKGPPWAHPLQAEGRLLWPDVGHGAASSRDSEASLTASAGAAAVRELEPIAVIDRGREGKDGRRNRRRQKKRRKDNGGCESGGEEDARKEETTSTSKQEQEQTPGDLLRSQKEAKADEGINIFAGASEEVGLIEWPTAGKAAQTTGVVMVGIVFSAVFLLVVNEVLCTLSEKMYQTCVSSGSKFSPIVYTSSSKDSLKTRGLFPITLNDGTFVDFICCSAGILPRPSISDSCL